MHGQVMDRDREESAIRWLGRRPMTKERMNGRGRRYLENRQQQEADVVILPVPCKK